MIKTINYIMIVTIILLGLANLVFTNVMSTQGVVLGALFHQRQAIEQDSQVLSEQLTEITSLNRIQEEARRLGFVPVDNIVTIQVSLPIADAQSR